MVLANVGKILLCLMNGLESVVLGGLKNQREHEELVIDHYNGR